MKLCKRTVEPDNGYTKIFFTMKSNDVTIDCMVRVIIDPLEAVESFSEETRLALEVAVSELTRLALEVAVSRQVSSLHENT